MLNSTVYHLGAGGKLTPVQTLTEIIGQKVHHGHRGKTGTICKAEMGGYTVIFDDGSSANSQTFDALSPFCKIRPVAPLQTVSQDEVERLIKLSVKYRNDQAVAQKVAATQKEQDIQRIAADLRLEYPKAKPGKASLNLKAELVAKFPGVKFSVRGDHNSINVKYTDGPSKDDVETIANKYKDGHFNGMEDIHEYDNSAYGKAFDLVCGRVLYMSVERSYSAETMQSAVDAVSTRYSNETPLEVKVSSYDGHAYIEHDWTRESQHRDVYELMRATDFRF